LQVKPKPIVDNYKRNIKASQHFEYGIYQILDHFLGRGRVNMLLAGRRRAFFKRLAKSLKASGEGKIVEIELITNLTEEQFKKNHLGKGTPVILDGAAKDWDCVKKWSFDYLKELHGDDEIVIANNAQKNSEFEFITLAEIIDSINSGGSKYYRFYPLLKRHPEHLNDFNLQWLRERRNKRTMFEELRAFIGGRGTGTPLHNENYANLFIQVYGEKEWILYPPSCTPVINPDRVKNTYRKLAIKEGQKPFDAFNPAYESPYELYKYIDQYRCDLKPGDVLWVPPFYWHTVANVTHSIGVGYRWFNPFASFRRAPLYMFLDFCATNPTFLKSIRLIKEDVNILLISQSGKLDKYRKEKAEREALRNKSAPESLHV